MKKILLILIFSAFYAISNGQNTTLKILNLPENPTNEDFSFLKEELYHLNFKNTGKSSDVKIIPCNRFYQIPL
jgi:hypothetical protein